MGSFLLQTVYLCTIGCCLYTSAWLMIKAGRNRNTWALTACQLLVILWCAPLLFTGFLSSRAAKYAAYGISYVGISFIGPAWVEFSFGYCKKRLTAWQHVLLFGISVLHYAMFLSNETHGLFYRQFELERIEYGPVFYIHMLYTYACVIGGMAVVLLEFKRKRVAAGHMAAMVLAAAVPLSFNVLYLSGMVKSSFDLTPPAFAWSGFLMFLAVFRYDLLDINAMAFEQIFSSISEGVIVSDRHGTVTYCNQSARDLTGIGDGDAHALVMRKLEALGYSFPETDMDDCFTPGDAILSDGRRIRLKRYVYKDQGGRFCAGTMLLTDVSEFYQILRQREELEFSGRRLAVEQERNRIAQEVHDTTGHTLTMIQSLLRLMQVELKKEGGDHEAVGVYLEEARELISGGIRELRCSINEMRQEREMTVTQSVKSLAEQVREIQVETEFFGEDGPAYSGLAPVVYGILREAVTNCLKYADAGRMDVILKFEPDCLHMYIFDDGKGCSVIHENNGIRGIREKAAGAKGTVRFRSEEGEGFGIYLELPVKEQEI